VSLFGKKYVIVSYTDPLSVEDREALRWYLEEYLQFPYGAERFKAEQVEKKMKEWGKSIFEQIFAKCDFDPDPRSLYQEAVRCLKLYALNEQK